MQPPSAPRAKHTPLTGSWQPPRAGAPPAALQPPHASPGPAAAELRHVLEWHAHDELTPVLAVNAAHVSTPAAAHRLASAQRCDASSRQYPKYSSVLALELALTLRPRPASRVPSTHAKRAVSAAWYDEQRERDERRV